MALRLILAVIVVLAFLAATVTRLGQKKLPDTVEAVRLPTREQQAERVNINQATLKELEHLPGIGHVTALRIQEYRAKNPPFRRVDELLIIRGISPKRLERIRNQIRVD